MEEKNEQILKIQGILEQVSNKDGKYGAKINGLWYNGFGEFDRDEGDKVEIIYKKNKQWNNVESFTLLAEATPETTVKAEELPITSIRRHKLDCLLKSVDCWLADKIKQDEVIPFGIGLFDALSEEPEAIMVKDLGPNDKPEVEVVKV